MGFLQPSPPPFDLEVWKREPFLTRLKANAQDWAVNGFGTPGVVYVLYIVKLAIYVVGAFLLIGATTPGFGSNETMPWSIVGSRSQPTASRSFQNERTCASDTESAAHVSAPAMASASDRVS